MKNKNVVLYGILALVAVVAIAFFTGRIPPKGNLEGTIGGANRYQSQQISETDVVLKDADVQAFLQSDLFHQIQTNPELAAVLTDPGVAEALRARPVAQLLGNAAAIDALQGKPGDAYRVMIKNLGNNAAAQLSELASDQVATKILTMAGEHNVTTVAAFDALVSQVQGGDAFRTKYAALWNEFSTMVAGGAEANRLCKFLGDPYRVKILGDANMIKIAALPNGFARFKVMPEGWNQIKVQDAVDKLSQVDGLRVKIADLPNR